MIGSAADFMARNVVRALRPPRHAALPAVPPPARGATLLLHSIDEPRLGLHGAERLRAALAPVAGQCVLTFDDGYAHTLPGLRRLAQDGHAIVLFLCGWLFDDPLLPKDRIQWLVATTPVGRHVRLGPVGARVLSDDARYRHWLAFRLNRLLMERVDRDGYVDAVAAATRDADPADGATGSRLRLASASELSALLAEFPSIRIGVHGQSHYRLDRVLTSAHRATEVGAVRRRLQHAFGRAVDAVAPPYGITDAHTSAWLAGEFGAIHLLDDAAVARDTPGAVLRIPADWQPFTSPAGVTP